MKFPTRNKKLLTYTQKYNSILKFSSKKIKKPVQPSKANGSKGFVIIINM